MKRLLVLFMLLTALLGNVGAAAIVDDQGSFHFLYTNTFDLRYDPSISVFCYKQELESGTDSNTWSEGCPGPNENLNIDSADGDNPQVTNEATITACGTEVGIKIVDDNEQVRVYDPNFGPEETAMGKLGCDYGPNGAYKLETTEYYTGDSSYGCTTSFLQGERCSVSGGNVVISRTEGDFLNVAMNTNATVSQWAPTGNYGDLTAFLLQNGETDNPVRITEYDSVGGNDVETRKPKMNEPLGDDETSLNDFLINSYDFDNCNSGDGSPCHVASAPFTGDEGFLNAEDCASAGGGGGGLLTKNRCPLGYALFERDITYQLHGELIYGSLYVQEPNADSGYKFYLCHDSVQGVHGRTVYSPGNNYEFDQFKCNSDGEWENVATCEDGRDNDDNGLTDLDDPDCGGNPQSSEFPGECNPVVAEEVSNADGSDIDQRVALYDNSENGQYSPSFSTCRYSSMEQDPTYSGKSPVTFKCEIPSEPGADLEATDYNGPTPDRATSYCINRDNSVGLQETPMPAVQYFVSEEVMPLGPSEWVGNNGYKPNFDFQTLHEAETGYDKVPGTNNEACDDCHQASYWEDKNMITDGYSGSTALDRNESWGVSNASGIHNEDVYYPLENTLAEDNTFRGGFHGVCDTGFDWMRNGGEWLCDIGPVDDPAMEINSYALTGNLGGKLAGFQIDWEEMQKWQEGHPVAPAEGGDGASPVDVNAMCWHGGPDERPQDLENDVVNLTASVTEGETTYVVGELPERSSTPSNPEAYSCVFGMSQRIRTDISPVSTQTTLFYEGSEDTYRNPAGETYGYITEGTDINGNLQIEDSFIQPSGDMQTWLEGKQASESSGDLWPNFRAEEDLTDADVEGGSQCQQIRHPLSFVEAGCSE